MFPLDKISSFFSLCSLFSKMTSFWELLFCTTSAFQYPKHTARSAIWWLVYTSLFLEDLGCGTLVQSRFYQHLSVCIGYGSRLLAWEPKVWIQILVLHTSFLQPIDVQIEFSSFTFNSYKGFSPRNYHSLILFPLWRNSKFRGDLILHVSFCIQVSSFQVIWKHLFVHSF